MVENVGRTGGPGRRRAAVLVLGLSGILACIPARALYVRYVAANFRVVVEGEVYRSGQPKPDHLKRWSADHEIRSIINLRGTATRRYPQELETASRLDIRLLSLDWSVRRLPPEEDVRILLKALEESERPLLIHCKSGRNRSAVVSVLAAMAVGGEDYARARRHLSTSPEKYRTRRNGVAGLLLQYEEHCRERGVEPQGWGHFRDWALRDYRAEDASDSAPAGA